MFSVKPLCAGFCPKKFLVYSHVAGVLLVTKSPRWYLPDHVLLRMTQAAGGLG